MTTIGGDIPALESLSASFQRQSGMVNQLLTELSSQLHATYWQGGRAERFRTEWESEYQPALRNLEAALTDASTHTSASARRLEEAGG